MIYQSAEAIIEHLEKEEKLWHETEIKISFGHASVNEETKKIYICPSLEKYLEIIPIPTLKTRFYDWFRSVLRILKE